MRVSTERLINERPSASEAAVANYADQYGIFSGGIYNNETIAIGEVIPEIWQYCGTLGDITLHDPTKGF